jgi:hypothetical protein
MLEIYTKDGLIEVNIEDIPKWKDDSLLLAALWMEGVDNWEGYNEAIELYQSWKEEEDDEG